MICVFSFIELRYDLPASYKFHKKKSVRTFLFLSALDILFLFLIIIYIRFMCIFIFN